MACVSVIVPIYNMEKYLNKCIDSILSQSLEDIDIILVDDGSTDSSLEICNQYANMDCRIKVIHQENMGLSGARNTGIKFVNSKWFAIIDADDWFEDDALFNLYTNAELYDSDIFIASFFANKDYMQWEDCFFNIKEFHFDNISDKTLLEAACINPVEISNSSCTTNVGVTWARLYRTAFIEKNNLQFIVGLRRTQDAIFNLYAYEYAKKIDYLDINVQHYRLWEGSASKKYNPNFDKIAIQIANELFKFINDKKDRVILMNAYYAKLLCLIIELILIDLLNKKNTSKFSEKLFVLKNICNNPLFSEAIQRVNLRNLSKGQSIAAIMLKCRLYRLTLIVYFLKVNL